VVSVPNSCKSETLKVVFVILVEKWTKQAKNPSGPFRIPQKREQLKAVYEIFGEKLPKKPLFLSPRVTEAI
jgi:hypothetical protein